MASGEYRICPCDLYAPFCDLEHNCKKYGNRLPWGKTIQAYPDHTDTGEPILWPLAKLVLDESTQAMALRLIDTMERLIEALQQRS